MADPRIKEYLSKAGIHKIHELDTALLEAFGPDEGKKHIKRLTELYDQSEARLIYGSKDTPYPRRQEELVDYLNQSLRMSLLAASFYDCIFFRRAMEYLVRNESFWKGDILDTGCGNGILTCFLAWLHPDSFVTGLDLSQNAVSAAKELAAGLQVNNVRFACPQTFGQKPCDTLFSCRTVHENVAWTPLIERHGRSVPSMDEQIEQYEGYAKNLSALVKPQGYLISIERYENDNACSAMVRALSNAGLCQVKGTYMLFSCRNGDDMAEFQAMIFQKNGLPGQKP